MERPERYPSGHFIPELIEDEDIIFNKDSEYHKQKKKEKKIPIFKRNKSKNRWALYVRRRNSTAFIVISTVWTI